MLNESELTASKSADSNVSKRVVCFVLYGALAGSLLSALIAIGCGVFFSAGGSLDEAVRIAVSPWRNDYVVVLAGYLAIPLIAVGIVCGATLAVVYES